MARRVKLGDVYSLVVRDGLVYLQTIGKDKSFGWAVRVLRVPQSDSDFDIIDVVAGISEDYIFLIGSPDSENLRFCGNAALPARFRNGLPLFRASSSYLPNGRHMPDSWWLDNGVKEWHVGELSAEQQHYPIHEFVPTVLIRERVDYGWDPEWEFKGPDAREYRTLPPPRSEAANDRSATFFTYFQKSKDARSAIERIQAEHPLAQVETEKGTPEDRRVGVMVILPWLASSSLENIDRYFESIALQFNGEYDGNEIPL